MKESPKTDHGTINFRPVLFCALGLVFGVILYGKIRFGGLVPSDFLFFALFLLAALRPLSLRRAGAILLLIVFAGAGALSLHLYTQSFSSALPEGEYVFTGTVVSVSRKNGYSIAVLEDLFFGGERADGSCRVTLAGEVYPADILRLEGKISPVSPDEISSDPYARASFGKDIRYQGSYLSYEKAGESGNLFLNLSSALYKALHAGMGEEEADVAYALLTGNSGSMDEGLSESVQKGGVAHIFAVSGLHIGIVFAAACFLFRPFGRYRFLPAFLLAFGYSALCNFTVSSVRALVMCAVSGVNRFLGRKPDFLNSLSFAAVCILLFAPAQWYTAGFKLSFGACLGLALFSGSFSRGLARLHIPSFVGGYLSATVVANLVTVPVWMESFGYFPAWGLLLNLVLLPLLPVFFILLLVCALLSVLIPSAASVFLFLPKGVLSLFTTLFSLADFGAVGGFALGAGGLVIVIACAVLSERVRLPRLAKCCAAAGFAALLILCLLFENVVFAGCRIDVSGRNGEYAALVRTRETAVLVLGGMDLEDAEDFLSRTYGGKLDAAVALGEDEMAVLNAAAFLGAEELRARDETETGLSGTKTCFGKQFTYGTLTFRYESRSKLLLVSEGVAVEIDFGGAAALGADLFLGGGESGLKYFLKDGKIISD